jgi:plasmid stabilization system protein ParE
MTGCQLSEQARNDIRSIWRQVAAESREGADRIVDSLVGSCDFLGTFQVQGEPWPGRPMGLRYYPVPRRRYVIVFLPDTDPVDIVAAIDGSRNLGNVSLD